MSVEEDHQGRLAQFDRLSAQCRHLFDTRNREYKGSFKTLGVIGILYEFNGIAGRLRALRDDTLASYFAEAQSVAEGELIADQRWVTRQALVDKLMDAVNYGLMALMLLEDENILGEG